MADEEDFDEEEVWAVMKDGSAAKTSARDHRPYSANRHRSSWSKAIRKSNADQVSVRGARRQSSPVHIPDWSKIYNQKMNEDGGSKKNHVDDDDYDDDGIVPPHEWIAKKLERSQISSSSVCEGSGRTLKGRDLSKVRNAVLTKTGFIE